ncbi:MAG: M91 family zinc metallopeptidase [Bacteroidota bacterium]
MPTTNTRNISFIPHSGVSGYYPFGMQMQGREFAGGMGYRWGFGSQETDNEVSGRGNSYTAEFWQYDNRLGRRWNIDPKPNASISTHSTLGNCPIMFMDPMGDTIVIAGSRGFINRTMKALEIMQTTDEGKRIYDKLHSSKNQYTIRKHDVNVTKVRSDSDLPLDWKVGDIGFTGLKYNGVGTFMGTRGWISLGHELSHAEDVENNASTDEVWQTPDRTFTYPIVNCNSITNTCSYGGESGPQSIPPLPMDEVRAMDRENKMRSQYGVQLRTHYSVVLINSATIPDGRPMQIRILTQQVVKDGIGLHPSYNSDYNALRSK